MDFFEKYHEPDRKELMNEMENLNERLVSIVKTLQSSPAINMEAEKNDFFQLLDSNMRKYINLIQPLTTILKTKDGILEQLKSHIVDEIVKLEEIAKENKWKRVVSGTKWVEATQELWAIDKDAGDDIVNSYYINSDSRQGYSDKIKDSKLDQFNISKVNYDKENRKFSEITQKKEHYQSILDNYSDFNHYAHEIINDLKNVIIFLNSDILKCVKKRIIPIPDGDAHVFNRGFLDYQHEEDEVIPMERDIIFVIFEDSTKYYGIDIEGHQKIGNINKYEVMAEPPKCGYFIISDLEKFVEKILDIQMDTKKKILFDNQFTKLIDFNCFMLYHNHQEDEHENWRDPCPACHGKYASEIIHSKLQNYKFVEYMLNPLSNKTEESRGRWDHNRVPLYPVHHAVWQNFIVRLKESNYNKKIILQQFKCLFTKDDEQETMLYQKIDIALQPKKLIELFIPEIKFLLHRIYIPNELQSEWTNYTSANNKPINTPPQDFLQYLLTVVLSNLVPKNLYLSLESALGSMMMSLTANIATDTSNSHLDLGMRSKMISQLIHKIVTKFVVKQSAGKLRNNKFSRKQIGGKLLHKKISKKQIAGKLRHKKTSRKHNNRRN